VNQVLMKSLSTIYNLETMVKNMTQMQYKSKIDSNKPGYVNKAQ